MTFDLDKLVRENVKTLTPYSSARGEFSGGASIFLDANENSFGSPLSKNYNRYPDPLQIVIKQRIAELNGVAPSEIFVGNGSDEAIDLLFRIFCRPQIDNALICPPTYGMYEVAAGINDVEVGRANLTDEYELDLDAIRSAISANTKLVFICSPNNPTGNLMQRAAILEVAASFQGIVVVDEAYIQFSTCASLVSEINNYANLVVLHTFSKAWGLAGLRVGLAFGSEAIIKLFNKVKPPYNVSGVAQELILAALDRGREVRETVVKIVDERKTLADSLRQFSFITKLYPAEANFVLVKMVNVSEVYRFLVGEQIVVRYRGNVELCEGSLRITVGTPEENQALLRALEKYETSIVY